MRRKTETFKALDDEQVDALVAFAAEHGERWKDELTVMWMRASAPPILHALRNSHGPSWLADYALAGTKPVFIAMFDHYWGRGYSPDEALAEARRHGGRGRSYVVYRMPEGTLGCYVDEMGRVTWRCPNHELRPVVVIARGDVRDELKAEAKATAKAEAERSSCSR